MRCPTQTFEEADLAKDGRISHEEWLILVQKHPVIINYMTLPVLREVGPLRYPYARSPGNVRTPCPTQVTRARPHFVTDDSHSGSQPAPLITHSAKVDDMMRCDFDKISPLTVLVVASGHDQISVFHVGCTRVMTCVHRAPACRLCSPSPCLRLAG